MGTNYPEGSTWKKWDPHLHTPASILNNNFGEDWDAYVKNLFKILIEKDIAAVGITDYFNIEGYKKIKKDFLSNEEKLKSLFSSEEVEKIENILLLPNVEFRSDIFVGQKSINFHVIFSEEVPIKDIEEKFLHDIHFVYQGEPQSEDKKRVLKEENLLELGAQLKSEHAEFNSYSDLYVGMMNAVVDHKEISKILFEKESIFGGKYIFVVADENLSDIDWNSRDHLTRKVLIQKSDMIFSSNKKTREWALGGSPFEGGIDKFIKEFKTLKPCIHGSDAHDYKYIGYPCAKRGESSHNCESNPQDCELRYCWIKADTTFEGLRQILYEPEDRVMIQPSNPTPIKSTQTITEFDIEASTLEEELKFTETKLVLNSGFIAITGGKGSGKTALVDLLANNYENRAICEDKNSFVKRISDDIFSNDLNTRVTLQSGQEFQKEAKNNSLIDGASIVYIAQGELEKHVEDPAHLETYINNLIFESNEIRDSALKFDYGNINDEVIETCDNISECNGLIFDLENETDLKIEESLNKEIKKLETDLKDIKRKIKELEKVLSPEKLKESKEKQKQLGELRDKKEHLAELGITIKETLRFIDEDIASYNKNITKINLLSKKLNFNNQFIQIEYSDVDKLKAFINIVRDELRKTINEIEKFQKELEKKEKEVKEHSRHLDKKKEVEKSILQHEKKLAIIIEKRKELAKELEKRNTLFERLLNKRIEQRDKYLAIIEAFSQNKNDILGDLEFTAELIFDRDRFDTTMSELVDLRKVRVDKNQESESDLNFFTSAITELVSSPSSDKSRNIAHDSIGKLLKMIVPNQKGAETINRLTIYNSIFSDYLSVVPSVKYKKVKLLKLSLGQKATVLIKIYLAQGENPIIIDSHDDHLDNEFIMDELVRALRQAKQHRQVIVVSNNGNVVVNSDAEQVIIAYRNEQGEISYFSGSLENPTLRPKLLKVLEGGKIAFSKRQQKYRLHP